MGKLVSIFTSLALAFYLVKCQEFLVLDNSNDLKCLMPVMPDLVSFFICSLLVTGMYTLTGTILNEPSKEK